MALRALDLESQLIEEVAETSNDPLAFAQRFYPWGEKELALSAGPRKWQSSILAHLRDHLQSANRFQPCFIAVASGKGIGKSALVSMIIDWAMSTCGDSQDTNENGAPTLFHGQKRTWKRSPGCTISISASW